MLRLGKNVVDTASGTRRITLHIPLMITDTQSRGVVSRITSKGDVKWRK